MASLIPAVLCCLLGQAEVELTTLDGESFSGPVVEWSDAGITVGENAVAAARVHRVTFAEEPVTAELFPVVTTADGSKLVGASVSKSGDRVTIEMAVGPVVIPLKQVAAVRFAALKDRYVETWTELLGRERRDDLFVRVRGDALDHVACTLGEVSPEKISLRVGDRDVSTATANAFGVLFANAVSNERVAGELVTKSGSEIRFKKLQWSEGRFEVLAIAGFESSFDASEIASIDLAVGRVSLLRDLEPRSVEYQPFGDNYDEYAWQIRKDRNALDQRLRLNGRTFASGYWVHSGTKATFELPPRSTRLQATIGIDELDTPGAPVQLSLQADGRSIFEGSIEPGKPQQLDLSLERARTLTLVAATQNPDGHGIREHLAIVNARLILE